MNVPGFTEEALAEVNDMLDFAANNPYEGQCGQKALREQNQGKRTEGELAGDKKDHKLSRVVPRVAIAQLLLKKLQRHENVAEDFSLLFPEKGYNRCEVNPSTLTSCFLP